MSDSHGDYLITPRDHDVAPRLARLNELGIGFSPLPEFDAFAQRLAENNDAPFAMVNLFQDNRQYFAGLYTAPEAADDSPTVKGAIPVGRTMPRDHGYCPHVVRRQRPLVLDDVCDYPRFHTNPVVDKIYIRSYIGAPLIDPSGIALGTICIVDQQVHPWGRPGLDMIKRRATELMDMIQRRASSAQDPPEVPDDAGE